MGDATTGESIHGEAYIAAIGREGELPPAVLIPWLHRRENAAHRYDAAYHRMRGTLPRIAPGTPVPYEE